MAVNYSYDSKFEGNILIVGQTGCGKTTFMQNLAKNNLFAELNKIFWISKIPPSSEREKNISTWFQKYVDFNYPQTIDELNIHLKFFQRKRQVDNDTDIVMGENNTFDKLIVMDNVLGRADKSDNFANFLTMSRKFNSTFVYVFHTMYPARSNWQMILSQTKNFNVFLGSLQTSSVIKVLSSYRNRYTYK